MKRMPRYLPREITPETERKMEQIFQDLASKNGGDADLPEAHAEPEDGADQAA